MANDPRGAGPRDEAHRRDHDRAPDEHDGLEALGIDEAIEDPDAEAERGDRPDDERHWADLNDEPGTTAMP